MVSAPSLTGWNFVPSQNVFLNAYKQLKCWGMLFAPTGAHNMLKGNHKKFLAFGFTKSEDGKESPELLEVLHVYESL